MGLIRTRYTGLCRACRRWIKVGDAVWHDGNGVRHVDADTCAAALAGLSASDLQLDGGSDPIRYWTEFERVGRLLEEQPWTFAKTMPTIPHYWAMRPSAKKMAVTWTEEEFTTLVLRLRQMGTRRKFRTSWTIKLDVNEHYYWTMAPKSAPPQLTDLINRAVRDAYEPPSAPYSAQWPTKTAAWMQLVGSLLGRSVLDIGGLGLEASGSAKEYLAIGAAADLERIQGRHSKAGVINTMLRSFVPREPRRFDVVLALYGVADMLDTRELIRLPLLLNPGGVVVAMGESENLRAWQQPTTEVQSVGGWTVSVLRVSGVPDTR